ncbi:sensor domain-containing diguanylate cyclase [Vibrio kyushuensis]|uniref:GGDEF domain-containing protein n=1 Tax=Vibrio kyushuensis TaxID=2910249 RepID=UPI003D0AF825
MKYFKIILPFFATTLALILISLVYYAQRYQTVKQDSFDQSVKEAKEQITYSHREYSFLRTQVISISDLLSKNQAMYDYVFSPTLFNKKQLEQVWSSTMIHQKWFPQIRYVDSNGSEQVSVKYSEVNDEISITNNLGDESHRDYFKLAQSLSVSQMGSWGIDLENENDSISAHNAPVFRIISPISVMQEKAGYLILNMDIGYVSSRFNYKFSRDFRPELISDQGYYIESHRADKLHGHLIERRVGYNLSSEYPKVWQRMLKEKSGYIVNNGDLFTFKQLDVSSNQSLFIVVQANKKILNQRLSKDLVTLQQEVALVFLTMLLFAIPTVFTFLHYRRRNLESKLARAAIDGMSAVVITNKQHRIVMVNKAFTSMTGLSQSGAINKDAYELVSDITNIEKLKQVSQLLKAQDTWEGEVMINNSAGVQSTLITRIQAFHTIKSEVDYYITTFVDITERKQLEDQLRLLSEKDELTNLYNRRKFEQALLSHAQIVERYNDRSPVCLAIFDIDFFKRVNDEKGHDEGDRVIRVVAQTLQSNLRQTDMIARIGGEEFAVILPNTSLDEATPVLERLRKSVEENVELPVTVSGGYTDLTSNSTDSYKRADIALYKAKSLGRNQLSIVKSKPLLCA